MPQEGVRSLRPKLTRIKTETEDASAKESQSPKAKKARRAVNGLKTEDNGVRKCNKKCDRSGCRSSLTNISCFANVAPRCVEVTLNTSRWHHLGNGEHYCNDCFETFYRLTKPGFGEYTSWKEKWQENSKTEASVRLYMMDQRLPYWIRCNEKKCRKWREVSYDTEIDHNLISTFTCAYLKKKNINCDTIEDIRVKEAAEPWYFNCYNAQPLLKNSPAADLLGAYYSDGVGLSPTCSRCISALKIYQEQKKQLGENNFQDQQISPTTHVNGMNPNFQPFCQPGEHGRAQTVRPDVISVEEQTYFGTITRTFPSMYLGVRNLIITLWNLNCKIWLTDETVESHLIVRGLIRLLYCQLAVKVLNYFTQKGMVNIGIIEAPKVSYHIPLKCQRSSVIVIGAGFSGLAAAKHLQNLGLKISVLEARNRLGGRILDDRGFNVCVGKGAHIVTGVINNPISFICEQTGLEMRFLGERCDLYALDGQIVDPVIDRNIEFHFNNSLDRVASWKKSAVKDDSLYNKILEAHQNLIKENSLDVTKEQTQLFNFHISNLEYACGSSLKNVSAMHWDQNEAYEQFLGEHTTLKKGFSAVIERLADGLNVQLEKVVKRIDYSSNNEVRIDVENGESYVANKVLVTIPLACLQEKDVEFCPPLPKGKQEALQRLGVGAIEKVVLQYPRCFWKSKINGADFFGCIPPNKTDRGQFPLFCDMSYYGANEESSSYVLMSYLCGEAVKLTFTKSDEEIIEMCANVLKGLFPDEDVPDPVRYFVTKWNQDPFSKMVYSFVKLGSSGEDYDTLAQDIQNKIYFAGEGTNRRHPQTVAGAYESGIREACKIVQDLV